MFYFMGLLECELGNHRLPGRYLCPGCIIRMLFSAGAMGTMGVEKMSKCLHCGGSMVKDWDHYGPFLKCMSCGRPAEQFIPPSRGITPGYRYPEGEGTVKSCRYCLQEFRDRTVKQDKKYCCHNCNTAYWRRFSKVKTNFD